MPTRDTIGATLLHLCALGALSSSILALTEVGDVGPATQGVELWRGVGYLFFAAVFVLLSRAPRQLRGLWEITILAKLALPLAALAIARDADDTMSFLIFDGILVVVLAVAYLLMSAWTAEPPRRSKATSR